MRGGRRGSSGGGRRIRLRRFGRSVRAEKGRFRLRCRRRLVWMVRERRMRYHRREVLPQQLRVDSASSMRTLTGWLYRNLALPSHLHRWTALPSRPPRLPRLNRLFPQSTRPASRPRLLVPLRPHTTTPPLPSPPLSPRPLSQLATDLQPRVSRPSRIATPSARSQAGHSSRRRPARRLHSLSDRRLRGRQRERHLSRERRRRLPLLRLRLLAVVPCRRSLQVNRKARKTSCMRRKQQGMDCRTRSRRLFQSIHPHRPPSPSTRPTRLLPLLLQFRPPPRSRSTPPLRTLRSRTSPPPRMRTTSSSASPARTHTTPPSPARAKHSSPRLRQAKGASRAHR